MANPNFHFKEGEDPTYGDRMNGDTGLKPGDIIIKTPTKSAVGRNVTYYNQAGPLEWPDMKEDSTVWVDANEVGPLDFFKWQNSKDLRNPWNINRATFRVIPGTGTLKSKSVSIRGLKNIVMRGINTQHLGLFHWGKSGNNFLGGNFAFQSEGFVFSTIDGGSIDVEGLEGKHGFTPFRYQPEDGFPLTMASFRMENCYSHNSVSGEGIYLNSTQSPPTPKAKNVRIKNIVFAQIAAEGIQVQNMNGSDISDINCFCVDTARNYPFQNFQITANQHHVNGGRNLMRNVLFDGYGNAGYMPYSVRPEEYTPEEINEVLHQNCAYLHGGGIGSYNNNVCSNGVHWIHDGVYYGLFNRDFYEHTGNKDAPFIISTGNQRLDKVTIKKLFHDGTKGERIFDDESKYEILPGAVVKRAMTSPKYRNSGFHEDARNIVQWSAVYAPWYEGANDTPTHWTVGRIPIEIKRSATKVLEKYEYYKVIKEHFAKVDVPPSQNPEHCIRLTWDANAVRSDRPEWDSSSVQSNLPPNDLRPAEDTDPLYKTMGVAFPVELPTKENITSSHFEGNNRVTTVGGRTYKEDLGNFKL